ncbi:MAG: hypothetical protein KME50_15830 [Nostoc desertorum CM1-VF14]|nr:hypothetical protein [Nostoc desertorum CM1-VF14]
MVQNKCDSKMTIISNMPSNGNIHHATYRSISLQRSLLSLLLDNVYTLAT